MKPTSLVFTALLIGTMATAQQPLSAIDWLDETRPEPAAQLPLPPLDEPPVSGDTTVPLVAVMPLDQVKPDAVGLLPSATTGLPQKLWKNSATANLTEAVERLPDSPLPAIQALYYTLLLAEADAPYDAGENARFLSARVNALMSYGAVSPALALLERANPAQKPTFDQWLSLSLLDGSEDPACTALRQTPDLSASYGARIYCTARAGDWDTAALTFDTAVALGEVSGTEADLLALYLDPELIDTMPAPPPPGDVSPLMFRLFEAAGAPLPTRRLPRAFAVADLRGTAGWKAAIEAAERLARTQALSANRLLGLYTDRSAAASGGVWDRVIAIQQFETALDAADAGALAKALPKVWQAMQAERLEISFAQLYGATLADPDLPTSLRGLAYRIGLLSPEYESVAAAHAPADQLETFLAGLARGMPDPELAKTPLQKAIADAFTATGPAPQHQMLLDDGKLGEAIFSAADQLENARGGNPDGISQALRTLRAVGLEDTARRAALQLLLLRRTG